MKNLLRWSSIAGTMLFAVSVAFAVQAPQNFDRLATNPDLSGFGLALFDSGGCVLGVAGSVTTDAGGGNDTFTFSIADGAFVVASEDFSLPADGAAHPIDTSFALHHVFADGDYDFVVDDPGGVGHLVFQGISAPASCVTQSVPTLSAAGLALFAGVLAAGAVWIVARRRRA